VTAAPLVVWFDSACDIWLANSSIWACACGKIVSRICRYAPISPDWMALLAIRSVVEPPGATSVMVPAVSWLAFALHCDVAPSVPTLLKLSCEACGPATSCWPVPANTEIWLFELRTTLMFISCDSCVMSWSR
jgi:hypothetical protein